MNGFAIDNLLIEDTSYLQTSLGHSSSLSFRYLSLKETLSNALYLLVISSDFGS